MYYTYCANTNHDKLIEWFNMYKIEYLNGT